MVMVSRLISDVSYSLWRVQATVHYELYGGLVRWTFETKKDERDEVVLRPPLACRFISGLGASAR